MLSVGRAVGLGGLVLVVVVDFGVPAAGVFVSFVFRGMRLWVWGDLKTEDGEDCEVYVPFPLRYLQS